MAKKAKHSKAEITTKLAQAADLATQGKLQSEIARTLGVSVMTLHRWRKMSPSPRAAANGPNQLDQVPQASRIAELQLENRGLLPSPGPVFGLQEISPKHPKRDEEAQSGPE
jgi:transposase-like protein